MDDQHKGHRLEAAAESTFAKLLNRFGMPLLLGAISYFASGMLTEIREQVRKQGESIAELRTDVRTLGTRLDEGVIRQVDINSRQLEDHEERLRVLERTTRTP